MVLVLIRLILIFITINIFIFTNHYAESHSGRTDRYGGHHDRKRGGYHYHNSGYKKDSYPKKKSNHIKQRIFDNGDKYIGEWKDDTAHGQGTYIFADGHKYVCLLYTSPSPRDLSTSRMPSSA